MTTPARASGAIVGRETGNVSSSILRYEMRTCKNMMIPVFSGKIYRTTRQDLAPTAPPLTVRLSTEAIVHSNEIPEGFCKCGCGQRTKIAESTNPKHGYVRGKPRDYVMGHKRRDGEWIVCRQCGKRFFANRARLRRRTEVKYCSSSCFGKSNIGLRRPRPIRALQDHPTDPVAMLVPLTKGYFAVIGREDAAIAMQYNWAASVRSTGVYAVFRSGGETIYLHRAIVLGEQQVDHKDGNPLNCRRSNLRPASHQQNSWNTRHPVGRSGFRGVWPSSNGRWQARIGGTKTGRINLGTFDTREQAARAVDAAARELYGEFAVLNFPDEEADA